ncbi:hypothetical protein PFISCL1PPCAC_22757, partial [Pristionchus fissidentatus]
SPQSFCFTPSRVAAAGEKRRRCLSAIGRRGNFTSFFWDAHAELIRDMMSPDTSFSSNGSFCDYSYSDVEAEPRYCNIAEKDSHSLATGGDSGVASSACSVLSDASTKYSKIRSDRGLGHRSQSSSTIDYGTWDQRETTNKKRGGANAAAKGDERSELQQQQQQTRRAPQRNTYASASFHHSRVSAPEGRYSVSKRKVYEDFDMTPRVHRPSSSSSSSAATASKPARPCCWECFEARVERDRVSAGLPTRTAYLP